MSEISYRSILAEHLGHLYQDISYGKEQHPQGSHLHQRQEGGGFSQPASTLYISSARAAEATPQSW